MAKKEVTLHLSTKYFLDDGEQDTTTYNTIFALEKLLYKDTIPQGGAQVLEAALGMRLAFLFGDGIQVTSDNDAFNIWVSEYIKIQKLNGSLLLNMCEQLETRGYLGCDVAGDGAIALKDIDSKTPTISYLLSPYREAKYQRTRLSLIVNLAKRYEDTLRKINTLNDKATNITPFIKVENVSDVDKLKKELETKGWKLGEILVGPGSIEYKSPNTGAVENFVHELRVLVKHISMIVGVPVHWLGWVDLTSNKAVADTMYDVAVNATLRERMLLTSFLYDVIAKANVNIVNNGDERQTEKNFTVVIPVFSQSKFLSIIDSMSKAYTDKVISVDEYRTNIPFVDASAEYKPKKDDNKEKDNDIKT